MSASKVSAASATSPSLTASAARVRAIAVLASKPTIRAKITLAVSSVVKVSPNA